ncbi:MotA/TolQ/ExbB proton channel family protein [Rhodopseudomonas palustris]|uniref:MotA/TolQ/ExbB proton channel family protein n=1 Tax=Rhodopseudomonas palustris TaxID=1076 RepID=UPI000641DEDB|nr:MotA/TolQ/ExbB proton channel family protein [Rhodopseudomonas palustris]
MWADLSGLLLAPVHLLIHLLFLAALFESGRLCLQWIFRLRNRGALNEPDREAAGYPIAALFARDPTIGVEQLDVAAMRRLEFIRIATRVTPMLGLIATLIPMGPALVALTKNDVAQMSELLRSAFSAVVLALAASSLCFWIATVRRRWCAEEVIAVKRHLENNASGASQQRMPERRTA